MKKGLDRLLHRPLLLRLVMFSVLWWILTEGNLENAWLGFAAAGTAALVSLRFWPDAGWRWSPRGFALFFPYFVGQSIVGGFDVSRRAFSPSLPLHPALCRFKIRLVRPEARAFLAWTIGLLPGTASVRLQEDRLVMHVLDETQPIEQRLRELEKKIAALFRERLP
jgi:multicomponent Na+:H+ antiporter subunit E